MTDRDVFRGSRGHVIVGCVHTGAEVVGRSFVSTDEIRWCRGCGAMQCGKAWNVPRDATPKPVLRMEPMITEGDRSVARGVVAKVGRDVLAQWRDADTEAADLLALASRAPMFGLPWRICARLLEEVAAEARRVGLPDREAWTIFVGRLETGRQAETLQADRALAAEARPVVPKCPSCGR